MNTENIDHALVELALAPETDDYGALHPHRSAFDLAISALRTCGYTQGAVEELKAIWAHDKDASIAGDTGWYALRAEALGIIIFKWQTALTQDAHMQKYGLGRIFNS